MRKFVQQLDYSTTSQGHGSGSGVSVTALGVCQQALKEVFDPYQDLRVKLFYLDEVCLPVLLRCSSASLTAMLCGTGRDSFSILTIDASGSNAAGGQTLIKQLMDLITKHLTLLPSLNISGGGMDADSASTSLLQICCCFSILETIYDRYN